MESLLSRAPAFSPETAVLGGWVFLSWYAATYLAVNCAD